MVCFLSFWCNDLEGFVFVMQQRVFRVFRHPYEQAVSRTSSCVWVVKLLNERIHFAGLPTLLTLFSCHTSIWKNIVGKNMADKTEQGKVSAFKFYQYFFELLGL